MFIALVYLLIHKNKKCIRLTILRGVKRNAINRVVRKNDNDFDN